jgi:hypothetical protein
LKDPSRAGILFFMIKYQDIFGDRHTTYVCRTVVYPPNPGQFTTRCPIDVPQDD